MNNLQRIAGRLSDIGEGMQVLRALPTRQRRMVGAWCFLDHLGPLQFAPEGGLHVGAHPHTALQTFTWLIEGELVHRDSLGTEQLIRPGQVNLMTAGHGVVHTEDSPAGGQRLHAAQLWIALPRPSADCPPAFAHYPDPPRWEADGSVITLLAGSFAGRTMPAAFHTPLVGLDIFSSTGSRCVLALEPSFEYGALLLEGQMRLGEESFVADEFVFLGDGLHGVVIELAAGSRLLLLGGEPFGDPVVMWWNFVGHDRQSIIAAQRAWEADSPRFGPVAGGAARRLVAPPLPWAEAELPAQG